MKVILLQDVPGTGRKYDVKEVRDGYGRNFLIARNLAKLATPQAIKKIEEEKKIQEEERKIQEDLLEKTLAGLENLKITIDAKENEKGHLFAGIHIKEIREALKKQHHLEIPEDMIELNKPIKETGEHKIKIKGREIILEII